MWKLEDDCTRENGIWQLPVCMQQTCKAEQRKRTKEVEVSGKTKKCNFMDTEVTVQKIEAGQRTLEETKRNMYIRLKN